MEQAIAWEQGMIDTLKNLVTGGYQCELAGNDDAARELETSAYRQACDIFGDHWWHEHDMECMKSRATAVESWELLLNKLEAY
jgi:hypothetical protein